MKIKKERIALIVILIIQIIVYVFLGCKKTYLHMDEAYSIGLTNYDKIEISQNEDFYNTWHTKEYYEDYISVNEDEQFDFKPVYENQKNDVHPPFYYLLLRLAYNLNIDKFSKWPGIILNIIILVLSNILVYKILEKIAKNTKLSLAICFVNGLVLASLESVMYIRMYALNALLLLSIAYIHLINFRKEKIDVKNYIAMGTLALVSSLTHYYNVLYIFVIAILYCINYIRKKQYKNIVKYIITMGIAAIMSLIIFPYSIQHIFMGYRGQGALDSLSQASKMLESFARYVYIADINIFNGTLWIMLIALSILIIFKLIKNRKITLRLENTELLLITMPAIIYFIVVALVSPYMEIRYIIPVCPFIFIFVIYELCRIINKVFVKESVEIIFTIILAFILLMPIFTKANINNLYLQHEEIVKQFDEQYHSIPTIYLFNTNQNRFLDDIYLFARIDESYILDIKDANKEKIEEILQNKNVENGIIVWVNEGFERDEYLKLIMEYHNYKECQHLKRMNACDIYYIH